MTKIRSRAGMALIVVIAVAINGSPTIAGNTPIMASSWPVVGVPVAIWLLAINVIRIIRTRHIHHKANSIGSGHSAEDHDCLHVVVESIVDAGGAHYRTS